MRNVSLYPHWISDSSGGSGIWFHNLLDTRTIQYPLQHPFIYYIIILYSTLIMLDCSLTPLQISSLHSEQKALFNVHNISISFLYRRIKALDPSSYTLFISRPSTALGFRFFFLTAGGKKSSIEMFMFLAWLLEATGQRLFLTCQEENRIQTGGLPGFPALFKQTKGWRSSI